VFKYGIVLCKGDVDIEESGNFLFIRKSISCNFTHP